MGIFFAVLIVSHLTDGRPQIEGDANTFVEGLLKQRFKGDTEIDDPTAAAALAYLKTVAGDDLCGKAAKVYVENIMRGEKKEVAMAEAGREYIDAFNAGARPASGSGCQAAEVAWKEAFVTGADPIPAAAKAYIRSWRSSKSKDPCTAASTKYFNEIQDGESHLDAAKYAMGAFVKALRKVNRDGRSYNDRACTNAAKAYAKALDEEQTPITAAFTAFLRACLMTMKILLTLFVTRLCKASQTLSTLVMMLKPLRSRLLKPSLMLLVKATQFLFILHAPRLLLLMLLLVKRKIPQLLPPCLHTFLKHLKVGKFKLILFVLLQHPHT